MTISEFASLSSSIASLILAIVAIWLSVFFYQKSSQLSESTKEAAKGIGASVERLEKLFDKLYADTFSMMRDTVSDMRRHIWPEDTQGAEKAFEEADIKADQKISALKDDFQKQLSEVFQTQKLTDERLIDVRKEISRLMERTIARSRRLEVEAREEAIREHIQRTLRLLQRRRIETSADEIVSRLKDQFPTPRIVEELEKMKQEGLIEFDGTLGPSTIVR